MTDTNDKPIDTLRLSRRDRERILEAMNRPDRVRADVDRRQLRVRFDVGRVFLALEWSDSRRTKYSVMPRNLSSQGMAFIHGQFIHEDNPCEVVMPALDGRWVRTRGRIVSCRHIKGCVHEASVVFEELIELDRFVPLTSQQRWRAGVMTSSAAAAAEVDAQAGAPALGGSALIVDRFESDRRLLRLWLSRMGIAATEVDDTAAALNAGLSRFDLVLLDPLTHRDGWAVVQRMRQTDVDVPIVGMSADDTDATRAAALGAGCNAFLGKPWEPAMLRLTAEQLLLIEPTSSPAIDGPICSTLAGDPEMEPLIRRFVSELMSLGEQMEDAADRRDMAALRAMCHQIKGAGAGYGFAPITDCARRLMMQFQAADLDVGSMHEKVDELVSLIHRTRA